MQEYILSLDQGTTSSRAVLFDKKGTALFMEQEALPSTYPSIAWVEQDPVLMYNTQIDVARRLLQNHNIPVEKIKAIGIANQRETTIVWNKHTGKPIYPAIVWQDRRTIKTCESLKKRGLERHFRQKTGLVLDTYFSATKIAWILENVAGAQEKAQGGELLFGTVDSWLIWNLSKGHSHVTDYTNASRTLLLDINELKWDEKILDVLNIPLQMLPQLVESSGDLAKTHPDVFGKAIPICGIAGDQQAALFGQNCFEEGMAKNTYGTGCFMLMNTGHSRIHSDNGLLSTIAWRLNGQTTYALEGSVFIAGAAIQWLRDGLKILDHAEDSEYFGMKLPNNEGVYVVPAFAGLGAPHWNMRAKGGIFGLSLGTKKEHLIRATLESLAYQSRDVLNAMEQDAGFKLCILNVDGGACANNFLMQFQSDILQTPVLRPRNIESTALGAAFLAGLGCDFWSLEDLDELKQIDQKFLPSMPIERADKLYKTWTKAVNRVMDWEDE